MTTLSILTFGITTLSIKGLFVTFSINATQYSTINVIMLSVAIYLLLNIVMLSVVMLNVIMLNVVMPSVYILSVVMLNVVAPV
jgi:hypothetical protein